MRKFIFISLLIVSVFFNLPVIEACADNEKIILCSDFESTDFEEWYVTGNGSLQLDSENSYKGNKSLKTVGRVQEWNGPTLTITQYVNAGKTYEFEGYVFHQSNTTETIKLSSKLVNSDGTTNYSNIGAEEVKPNTWTKISGTLQITPNVLTAEIYVESPNESLIFNIDNICIKGEPPVTSSNIDNKEEFDYDFEEDFESWLPRGSVKLKRSNSYSSSGANSLYISNREETWNGATVNIDTISRNTDYLYTANIMYTGNEYADKNTFLLQIQYEKDGIVVYDIISRKEIQKNSWSKLEGEYTLPKDAKNVYFYIQTENVSLEFATVNDLVPFYIDNIHIIDGTLLKQQKIMKIISYSIIIIIAIAIVSIIIFYIIKIKKKTKETLSLASKDAMTKAFNRNTYEEKIKLLEQNPDMCKSLYIAVCDVNFLKYLNDNYGHKEGDEAIIRCANVLLNAVGKKGEVYRTGGDEFVCITNVSMKNEITDKMNMESKKYNGYPFFVASGFAEYNQNIDGETPNIKDIISRADKNMYIHKHSIKKIHSDFARK